MEYSAALKKNENIFYALTYKKDRWLSEKNTKLAAECETFLRKESDMNTYLYLLAITLRNTREAKKLNRRK